MHWERIICSVMANIPKLLTSHQEWREARFYSHTPIYNVTHHSRGGGGSRLFDGSIIKYTKILSITLQTVSVHDEGYIYSSKSYFHSVFGSFLYNMWQSKQEC